MAPHIVHRRHSCTNRPKLVPGQLRSCRSALPQSALDSRSTDSCSWQRTAPSEAPRALATGAIDEGALRTAADGTRRSLSGWVERASAGNSRRRRSGPGGALSSSSGRVLGRASRRHLGSHRPCDDEGLTACVARSLAVGPQRAARGAAGERASDGKSRRRRGPGRAWSASSGIVSGDPKRF